jgi:aminopeptidase N
MQTPWDDRSIFQPGLVRSEQGVLDGLGHTSVYHLNIVIADDLYHVSGMEEVRYINDENIVLNEIYFRLFPNILGGEMTVTNITVDGQSTTPSYDLQNSLMIVPLSQSLASGKSVVIKMEYIVTVPQAAELNYGVLAYYEDTLALAHAYPIICVYDDEGWNAEFPPQRGDITYADAAFFIVRITAPKGLTLVTSGNEISLDEAGQAQALTVASGPARDFYLVASPNFEVVSKTVGEVTVHSYAPEDSQDGANLALETALNAIRIFGERYAPYPYTELDIVATPTTALGIEYPGMIAITNRIYDVGGEFRGSPTSVYLESTVAHEVGHQWFYNLVGNDQLDDPWLDESLTQFATLQYFTDQYGAQGADGFRASLKNRWAGIGNAELPIGQPVASYTGGEYGAIVYGRGPLFFEALKEQIGTGAFNAFLKEYTALFSWRIAEPRSLQALVEKHCGCDLQALFDEWVYP